MSGSNLDISVFRSSSIVSQDTLKICCCPNSRQSRISEVCLPPGQAVSRSLILLILVFGTFDKLRWPTCANVCLLYSSSSTRASPQAIMAIRAMVNMTEVAMYINAKNLLQVKILCNRSRGRKTQRSSSWSRRIWR